MTRAFDRDFGSKLKLVERAVGFRFPAAAFSNDALARLLETTKETMSRKKTGVANVTDHDISVLTNHFRLGRYGFEVGMFTKELREFAIHIGQVEQAALGEGEIDDSRRLLFNLAREQNGTIHFDVRDGHRGGIGTVAAQGGPARLRETDEVAIRLTVPADGYLLVLNDDGHRQVTCLMPAQFAPDMAVKIGTVRVPTDDVYGYFPVGGPVGAYRLLAIWMSTRPQLSFVDGPLDRAPRDLTPTEFRQLVGLVQAAASARRPFKVAMGDYVVVPA